jgi:hypothetical protein
MLAARLVQIIESHPEDLTGGAILDLQSNPLTPHYHHLSYQELRSRTYSVYRSLAECIRQGNEGVIATDFSDLAVCRYSEAFPLAEVVAALTATKNHLFHFVQTSGMVDVSVELRQERELRDRIRSFFDKAIYHAVQAYEDKLTPAHLPGDVKAA